MSLPNLCKLARIATWYKNDSALNDLSGDEELAYRFRGVEYQMIETRLQDHIFNSCKLKTAKGLVDILSTFYVGEHFDNLLKRQTSYWIVTVGDCRLFVAGHWKVYQNQLFIELTSVHLQRVLYDEDNKLLTSWAPIPGADAYTEIIEMDWMSFDFKQDTLENTLKQYMEMFAAENERKRKETGYTERRHEELLTKILRNPSYIRFFKNATDYTLQEIRSALSILKNPPAEPQEGLQQNVVKREVDLKSMPPSTSCASGLFDGTNKSLSTGAMNIIMQHRGSHMQLSHKKSSHKESDSTGEFPHIGDRVDVFISNRDETGSNFPMQDRADVTRALRGVLDLLHGASSNKRCIAVYGVDMNPDKRLFPGETVIRPAGKCLLYLVRYGKVVDMLTAVVAVNEPHKIYSVQSIFHTNFGISKAITYWKAVEDFTYEWFEF